MGVRVRVPFGRRILTGVVIEAPAVAPLPGALRRVLAVIDERPLLTPDQLTLLRFAADYYHHPLGEVLFAALPGGLKRGRQPAAAPQAYRLTAAGRALPEEAFARARRKGAVWQAIKAAGVLTASEIKALGRGAPPALRALLTAGHAECCEAPPVSMVPPTPPVRLRPEQAAACAAVHAAAGVFAPFLLFGVTGSGKTEVYLELAAEARATGGQVLVLVPEIGLTPQLVRRFQARFGDTVGVLHSGCTDAERVRVWSAAAAGRLGVLVGTRSAVFAPMQRLALIIVDEEHDASFKQQEGFRYHARDLAVLRAQRGGLPIVLGSATPSLESYRHACEGRYRLLSLPTRGPDRTLPAVRFVDLARTPARDGLSGPLVEALRTRLGRGEQSLLFLNRRGYAPVLFCPECRWHAPCDRCDARLTVHASRARLRCHHCGHERPLPAACPRCGHARLLRVGEGTERVEQALRAALPAARVARIDRDTVGNRIALDEWLRKVHDREVDILVGTQMLAKGHDFPHLTLVGVVQADQGLHGRDFRADEQLFAQIVQVAGRAGRGVRMGEVLIQTYHPEHPIWAPLARFDYAAFADVALQERRATGFPPYAYCALLRAEAKQADLPARFLEAAKELGRDHPEIVLGSVIPAVLARRAGYFRAQLLVSSERRGILQAWLRSWVPALGEIPGSTAVRWSIDVDPYTLF